MNNKEVKVVISRCEREKKIFGIRLEKNSIGKWIATWAFPLKESSLGYENYWQEKITGTVSLGEEYPGCPYCGAHSFFHCGICDKLSCYDGSEIAKCANCGDEGRITGVIEELKVGSGL